MKKRIENSCYWKCVFMQRLEKDTLVCKCKALGEIS
jgi:hypothetical protein